MSTDKYDQAFALCAIWRLGAPENMPMPISSQGLLDRALERSQNDLPQILQKLTFSDGSAGRRCLELPDIILAAEDVCALEINGRDFTTARVPFDELLARGILIDNGLSTADGRRMGRALKDAVVAECRQ